MTRGECNRALHLTVFSGARTHAALTGTGPSTQTGVGFELPSAQAGRASTTNGLQRMLYNTAHCMYCMYATHHRKVRCKNSTASTVCTGQAPCLDVWSCPSTRTKAQLRHTCARALLKKARNMHTCARAQSQRPHGTAECGNVNHI